MSWLTDRFWLKADVRSSAECWNWRGKMRRNGKYQWPSHDGIIATRVAYKIRHGRELSRNEFAIQACGNRHCVNPAHVEVENRGDKFRVRAQKLSPADVEQAKYWRSIGIQYRFMAPIFGVDETTIRRAARGLHRYV